MSILSWRKLQKLAYVFYGLIFVHIMLFLVPSAMGGASAATISVIVYLVLGLLYLVFRYRQYKLARNSSKTPVTSP